MKNLFLYPGQGAQSIGMGQDLYEKYPSVKNLFEQASDITNIKLADLIFNGTEDELKQTENTQIAITLINVSSTLALREVGIEADACAGFSLGEYTALWNAGVLSTEDLFKVVQNRGLFMGEAGKILEQESNGTPPGMAAIIGLPSDKIEELLAPLYDEGVYIANYNSPIQTVIAGVDAPLKKAMELLKENGAKRCIALKVSGPFHTPLLQRAADKLKESFKDITFNPIKLPVYSNATGQLITADTDIRELSYQQVINPVRWTKIEEAVIAAGVKNVYEVGPGTVLTGLWKAVCQDPICKPAGSITALEALTE